MVFSINPFTTDCNWLVLFQDKKDYKGSDKRDLLANSFSCDCVGRSDLVDAGRFKIPQSHPFEFQYSIAYYSKLAWDCDWLDIGNRRLETASSKAPQ